MTLDYKKLQNPGGGTSLIHSYGGVRRKHFCYDPIPEIWSGTDTNPRILSDNDTQSQNFEEVTKTMLRQRDKRSRAENDNFCPKWPLERSSDLSTFLNKKIHEICSLETDHMLLEELSSCTFIQHP